MKDTNQNIGISAIGLFVFNPAFHPKDTIENLINNNDVFIFHMNC